MCLKCYNHVHAHLINGQNMSTNLATGALNLVKEIVYIRLYCKCSDGVTLTRRIKGKKMCIYRPSDDTESFLYSYRAWLCENTSREKAIEETGSLYPIATISISLAEYLKVWHNTARNSAVDRESWMKLVAMVAGGMSLVDEMLALSKKEASTVNKWDTWSGAITHDPDIVEGSRYVESSAQDPSTRYEVIDDRESLQGE